MNHFYPYGSGPIQGDNTRDVTAGLICNVNNVNYSVLLEQLTDSNLTEHNESFWRNVFPAPPWPSKQQMREYPLGKKYGSSLLSVFLRLEESIPTVFGSSNMSHELLFFNEESPNWPQSTMLACLLNVKLCSDFNKHWHVSSIAFPPMNSYAVIISF